MDMHKGGTQSTKAQTGGTAHKETNNGGEKLNVGLWSRSMAARFPKNYSERVKQEISGPDGTQLKTGFILSFEEPKHDNDSGS